MIKLETLEEFQKFIYDNDIKSSGDFKKNYTNIYHRAWKRGYLKLLKFTDITKTYEYAQDFIYKNNITSLESIRYIDLSLYSRIYRRHWNKTLKFPNRKIGPIENPFKGYDSPKVVQEFLDKNKVLNQKDLRDRFPKLYSRVSHKGFMESLVFSNPLRTHVDKNLYDSVNTIDEFINFIKTNNIKSSKDFMKRYFSFYRKMVDLGISDKIKYPKIESEYESSLVEEVVNILKENNIEYSLEERFDWLVYYKKMKLDIFLPEYNIAIECHGIQHFKQSKIYKSNFEYEFKRDKKKFEECSNNKIRVIYYTNLKTQLDGSITMEEFKELVSNYFQPVFTDLGELLKAIK